MVRPIVEGKSYGATLSSITSNRMAGEVQPASVTVRSCTETAIRGAPRMCNVRRSFLAVAPAGLVGIGFG